MTQTLENTWESIELALRPIVQTDRGAQAVASAFYDVAWVPIDSPYRTYSEAFQQPGCFSVSWRGAGDLVAEIRGRGENYMDWCFDAESEVVDVFVLRALRALGLRPVV